MILLFGKNGQVGNEISKYHAVTALGRDDADLTVTSQIKDIILEHHPRVVINAAAYTNVDNAEKEQSLALKINGIAPKAMAESCEILDIPFIHISTDYVFDGSGTVPWKEDDQPGPRNAYGRTKLFGENAIKLNCSKFVILRTSWVFSERRTNFLNSILRLSEIKDDLGVVHDQIGGPTPASDIAKTCLKIAAELEKNSEKSGIYHYSGYPNVSWYDFANAIICQANLNLTAFPLTTEQFPSVADRPKNTKLDCTKIFNSFNIRRPRWEVWIEKKFEETKG